MGFHLEQWAFGRMSSLCHWGGGVKSFTFYISPLINLRVVMQLYILHALTNRLDDPTYILVYHPSMAPGRTSFQHTHTAVAL